MFAMQEFITAIPGPEPDWQAEALCADGTGALVELPDAVLGIGKNHVVGGVRRRVGSPHVEVAER